MYKRNAHSSKLFSRGHDEFFVDRSNNLMSILIELMDMIKRWFHCDLTDIDRRWFVARSYNDDRAQ
jgi:hypothetical protein